MRNKHNVSRSSSQLHAFCQFVYLATNSLILLCRHQIQSLGHVHKKEMEHIKDMLNFPEMLLLQNPPNLLEGNRVSTSEQQPSDPKTADKVSFQVIGHVSTWFSEKRATPRQPGICKSSRGKLELSKDLFTNPEHSLEGLASFSHLWHVDRYPEYLQTNYFNTLFSG
jgi:hypothetical protein